VKRALIDAGFQVVLYDLRGHGHFAKPHDPGSYDLDAHVDDVQSLVAHLGNTWPDRASPVPSLGPERWR
jgi:pimeloyl-ACP methyl ester carboxylesterase